MLTYNNSFFLDIQNGSSITKMGIGTYMVKSRAQNACSDGGGIQLWRLSAELKKEFNVKRFINA